MKFFIVADLFDKFWINSLNAKTYYKLKQMNTSKKTIIKWQKNRCIVTLLLFSILGILAILMKPSFIILAIFICLFFYFYHSVLVNKNYLAYKFERNLQFTKFARLVIPYLHQAKYGIGIYQILSQILPRMNSEDDKQLLRKLMVNTTNFPNSVNPFVDFAKKMSNTDFSITFMVILFDISQGAFDNRIINELGQEVTQQLMTAIDDIISYKQKKFMMFPTKLTMINFILIIGYLICILMYEITKLGNFGSYNFN